MTYASESVFNTPELLENVLAQLPMRDLLLSQVVCKAWKIMIESSPRLQEALFFKPSSTTRGLPSSSSKGAESSLICDDFQRNPLLESKFPPFFSKPVRRFQMPGETDLLCMPWNEDEVSRAAYNRAEASWRRMLLVQPAAAISDVELVSMRHAQGGDALQVAEEYIDPVTIGLRMGWVYDRCYAQTLDSSGKFMLRWQMLKSEKLWAPKLVILLHRTISCVRGFGMGVSDQAAMKSRGDPGLEIKYCGHSGFQRLQQTLNRGWSRVPSELISDAEDFECGTKNA